MGKVEQAHDELEVLRVEMRRPLWQKRAKSVFAEAEALIGSSD